ncbi:MAG: T9SS type A sorting domain-containing protein, partial [Bacteroidales bacterium]
GIPGSGLNEPENGAQVYPGYGGDVAWSMIFPTSICFASGTSNPPFIRSEDYGVTPSPTFMSVITNPNYAAINYWENFNFTESADSIKFIVKAGPIAKDSTFDVLSSNEKFPIHYTAPHDFAVNDTIKVQDVVQTRFFISGTANNAQGIFMTKQALQYSVDPIWFRIGDISATDVITCITVSKDLSVLWAGTQSGNIYRLTNVTHANDSTTAFADSAGCVVGHMLYDSTIYAQFKGRYITSIALSPDNKTVMVTLGNYGNTNYIYKTTNGLDSIPTFVSAQGNLPAMPVYSGVIEMSNPDIAILGTDFGVFSTSSISAGSPIWTDQNSGTGNVPVTKIIQQTNPGLYYHRPENYGDLYMASFGRGLFFDNSFGVVLGTDPINSRPAEVNRLKVQPNPFTNDVYISYKLGKTAPVNISVYDLSGRSVYSTSFGTQQAGEYIKSLNLGSLSNGTYIIKLDYGAGSLFGKAMKVN